MQARHLRGDLRAGGIVTTPTNLDELDRLRDAATPGELYMDAYHHSDGAISYDLSIGDYEDLGVIREPSNPDKPEKGNRKALAELIVALVNAYPALAAELRELRKVRDEVQQRNLRYGCGCAMWLPFPERCPHVEEP